MVFDGEGSYIYNKTTGESTRLREENGVYLLDVCVAPTEWKPEQGVPMSVVNGPRTGVAPNHRAAAAIMDQNEDEGGHRTAFAGPRR